MRAEKAEILERILALYKDNASPSKYFIVGNIIPKIVEFFDYSVYDDLIFSYEKDNFTIDAVLRGSDFIVPIMVYPNNNFVIEEKKNACEILFNFLKLSDSLYGVLTNGEYYIVFVVMEDGKVEKFVEFHIADYIRYETVMSLFLKSNIAFLKDAIEIFKKNTLMQKVLYEIILGRDTVFNEYVSKLVSYDCTPNDIKNIFLELLSKYQLETSSMKRKMAIEQTLSLEDEMPVKLINFNGQVYSVSDIINSELSLKDKILMLKNIKPNNYILDGSSVSFTNWKNCLLGILNRIIQNYSEAYTPIVESTKGSVSFNILTKEDEDYLLCKNSQTKRYTELSNGDISNLCGGKDGFIGVTKKILKICKSECGKYPSLVLDYGNDLFIEIGA